MDTSSLLNDTHTHTFNIMHLHAHTVIALGGSSDMIQPMFIIHQLSEHVLKVHLRRMDRSMDGPGPRGRNTACESRAGGSFRGQRKINNGDSRSFSLEETQATTCTKFVCSCILECLRLFKCNRFHWWGFSGTRNQPASWRNQPAESAMRLAEFKPAPVSRTYNRI